VWIFEVLETYSYVGLAIDPKAYLRTEDARFSPTGKLIALAAQDRILLLEVDIACLPLRVKRGTELYSAGLAFPHGVDFLSEDVIVVANREAWVTFFRIPNVDTWGDSKNIDAIHEFSAPWFGLKRATRIISTGRSVRCGPGSVRVHGDHLYVCTNKANTVTKHPFTMHNGKIDVGEGSLVAQAGLEILDGIAISRDGRWIALADAGHNRVVVFSGDGQGKTLILRDPRLHSPHGLCFSPSGGILYVSDAGHPLVHVFESRDGRWDCDMEYSSFSLPGISEEAFRKTKASVPEEFRHLVGGLKGLDIHPSGRFLVGTCLNQLLTFFNTRAESIGGPVRPALITAAESFETDRADVVRAASDIAP
jgi:hypothetical protein